MSNFTYIAFDSQGKEVRGLIEADSARLARQQLRDRGLTPIEVESYIETTRNQGKAGLASFLTRGPGLTIKELALATRQMATLLTAGIPLEEVLQAVGEQSEKPKTKSILFSVRSKVLEGNTLAAGLMEFPQAFPALYCSTVAAGEQTGQLDTVLNRLADYTERQQHMRQKIQQALIYPSVMTAVSIGIVIFLMIFVVPKMVDVFTTSKQTLPFSTQILLFISHGMKIAGPVIIVLVIGLSIGFNRLLRKNLVIRKRFHQVLLRIPLLGNVIKTINTARFSRTFGILLAAGVPVLEAMNISAELVLSLPIRDALQAAILRVREGVHISQALKQTGYFPAMSLHLIASGEASGQLENMLERAANNQEQEVERLIDTLLTLFEPLLILVMGSVVLFIVMAVLLPIFSLDQLT
jgi:general secretion pathway protein F